MHIINKLSTAALGLSLTVSACTQQSTTTAATAARTPLEGTWRLVSGTVIEKNDTTVTDYTQGKSFIKVINASHFAFTGHDLHKGKDSTAFFSSGAGTYELHDSAYTEKLAYCSDREWEGNEFHFTVSIVNDTLTQQGVEKVEGTSINRVNIEKYVRIKD
ncbi:MAG TPA: hypothetical protein VFS25_10875 [Chitinophaga sp.]|uniref:hypothetical protein n=1 Tax=Chitinophaga sp. TaxID=1869181 RepID=UPI002DBA4A12|nr:hypothetical protein [Chitinophaga sp.]HEU4553331.1 hypothetical protein [Chitinophaga sp.]